MGEVFCKSLALGWGCGPFFPASMNMEWILGDTQSSNAITEIDDGQQQISMHPSTEGSLIGLCLVMVVMVDRLVQIHVTEDNVLTTYLEVGS